MFEALAAAVVRGDPAVAEDELRVALGCGAAPSVILNQGLMPAMEIVGQKFGDGEFYVPEMLMAARAMKHCVAILEPLVAEFERESIGKVVIGTVRGDLHDIGKNLVAMMLRGAGFDVHDLGADVAPEEFVAAVQEERPHIVGLSCLLTSTMPAMREVLVALEAAALREDVRVLIGGAPVTEDFARAINADVFAPDAGAAIVKARQLLGEG